MLGFEKCKKKRKIYTIFFIFISPSTDYMRYGCVKHEYLIKSNKKKGY